MHDPREAGAIRPRASARDLEGDALRRARRRDGRCSGERDHLPEELLAHLGPGSVVRGQDSTSMRSSLAVEAAGHRLGGQGPREEAEASATAPSHGVGRVGEPRDHARQEARARIVRVQNRPKDAPSGVPVGDVTRAWRRASRPRSPRPAAQALSRCRRTSSSLARGRCGCRPRTSTTSGITWSSRRRDRRSARAWCGSPTTPAWPGWAQAVDGFVQPRGIGQRFLHGDRGGACRRRPHRSST